MINIHIEWITVPAESFQEKKNLAFVSGDLPDAFFGAGLTPKEEIMYGGQGILVPLEGLVEKYGSGLKKLFEIDPAVKKAITTPNGHIYALPQVNGAIRDQTPKFWFNQSWLDKLGLKMPKNADELYNALKAFKEQDANGNGKEDEIPMSLTEGEFKYLLGPWGILDNGNHMFVEDNGEVVYVPIDERYKEALQFFNKLFKEKLLDPESFTQTKKQITAKGNEADEILGSFFQAAAFLAVGHERDKDYLLMPALEDRNGNKMWIKTPTIIKGTFAITNVNRYPEATLRWVDYFYTLEGGIFARFGPEGVGYTWNDDGTWNKHTPEGKNPEEWRASNTPAAGTPIPFWTSGEIMLKQKNEINERLDKLTLENYTPYLREPYPQLYLTDEQQSKVTSIEADVNAYVDQMMARFITGDASFDEWKNYINTLKQMRIDELLKVYQEAYDAYKNS